jgi:hypothetical protein
VSKYQDGREQGKGGTLSRDGRLRLSLALMLSRGHTQHCSEAGSIAGEVHTSRSAVFSRLQGFTGSVVLHFPSPTGINTSAGGIVTGLSFLWEWGECHSDEGSL